MSLREKALLIVAFGFLFLMAGVYFLSEQIISHQYEAIEEKDFQEDLLSISETIRASMIQVRARVKDWSNWDDAYQFMHNHNHSFVESNITDETLDDLGLHLLTFWDENNRLVVGRQTQRHGDKPVSVSQDTVKAIQQYQAVLFEKSHDSAANGYIMFQGRPMMIAANPILKSDHTGPVRGTIIVGRFLDQDFIHEVQEMTRLKFRIAKPSRDRSDYKIFRVPVYNHLVELRIIQKMPTLVLGRAILNDLLDRPVMQLEYQMPRYIYMQGQKNLGLFMLCFAAVGFLFLAATYFVLENWVLSRIRDLNGQVQGVASDITKRIIIRDSRQKDEVSMLVDEINEMLDVIEQTEVKLNDAKQQAEKASVVKGEFLANMSHELRTPLNGILGMCQHLKMMDLNSAERDAVETIVLSGETLLYLINDILDFSKVEAGKMAIEQIPFHIRSWVENVRTIASAKILEKNLEFQVDIAASVPETLIGDPIRIQQVALNLLTNATKFTHKGHILFMVDYIEQGENEGHFFFSVEDTGIGIPASAQSGIFDKFSQADASTTRKYGGTGLGLAISKQIIALLGGDIGVISEEGKGSRFWAYFPVKLPKETDKLITLEEKDTAPAQKEFSEAARILLAEDNLVNQKVCLLMLKTLGLQADVASNGLEVLQKLEETDYDLILMDCQMPEMDGYEATGKIRSLSSVQNRIPIIALTANALAEDELKCREAGMDDYLTKPLNKELLIRVLNRWLRRATTTSG